MKLLPRSLFEGLDTPEGIFLGEVLVRYAHSGVMEVGVATEMDSDALAQLSAFELQEPLLAAAQRALREGLLAHCSLFLLALQAEPMCVLRLWYDRRRDARLLDRARWDAVVALCDAFRRDMKWQHVK